MFCFTKVHSNVDVSSTPHPVHYIVHINMLNVISPSWTVYVGYIVCMDFVSALDVLHYRLFSCFPGNDIKDGPDISNMLKFGGFITE